MEPTYISIVGVLFDWTVFQGKLDDAVLIALAAGTINKSDIMWRGPSGDYMIASDSAELDEEYADYIDAGMVDEYLHRGLSTQSGQLNPLQGPPGATIRARSTK